MAMREKALMINPTNVNIPDCSSAPAWAGPTGGRYTAGHLQRASYQGQRVHACIHAMFRIELQQPMNLFARHRQPKVVVACQCDF